MFFFLLYFVSNQITCATFSHRYGLVLKLVYDIYKSYINTSRAHNHAQILHQMMLIRAVAAAVADLIAKLLYNSSEIDDTKHLVL